MSSPPLRCFLAIELDHRVRDLIKRILTDLKQSKADVKWVEPANSHLTLKFLGDVESDRIDPVRRNIREIASAIAPFSLKTFRLGAFPKLENPRVIWLACAAPYPELRDLAGRLEENLKSLGFSREEKDFVAHITIGRVRSRKNRSHLAELLKKSPPYPEIEQDVDHITLFKSTLKPARAVYEVIEKFPFLK